MNRFSLLTVALLACFVALCAPQAARAATQTASMSVSAEVVSTCNVAVSGMAKAGSASCSQATSYSVGKGAAADAGSANGAADGTNASSAQAGVQGVDAGVSVTTVTF
jgi:hypothetical protein